MKNRTKGLLALILVLALIGGLTACGSGGSVEMTGGWSMPVQNAVELPKDVKAGFEQMI